MKGLDAMERIVLELSAAPDTGRWCTDEEEEALARLIARGLVIDEDRDEYLRPFPTHLGRLILAALTTEKK